MKIEKKKLNQLTPYPNNPLKTTQKQESDLQKSLEKFGVVEPIIYNERTGYIVGGHFRARELEKLGYKEIDCVIVDLSQEDEKELNIRLNANTGEFDWDILNDHWDYEELDDWGLDAPFNEKLDDAEEDEVIEVPKSLQVMPKKEYIIIMADEGSDEWEELKSLFKCELVRTGGCRLGSSSDKSSRGLERVFDLKTFKERIYGV